MSGGMTTWGRRAAVVAGAAGVVAAGAAVGLAAERYAVGRSFRGEDAEADEPLGQLRGEAVPVRSDDGVALHTEVERAAGDAPVTVVFSHGLALDQGSWHYQRRDLAGVGTLVFWDQRGHGRSSRGAPERATIDQLGADLLAVIEATAPTGPIVLVGHSMGGMTIMALADAHPELFGDRVVGVALISTSPGKLAEVSLGVPAAAGRALRKMAPKALAALNRRPGLVAGGRKLGADVEFVLTKRYSFATDGVPLHVEVDGPQPSARKAPPVTVVFCHGLALNLDSWHYQRRDLADLAEGGARLVFWDQRGHGRSGRGTAEHATIDQLGRDLRSVL